ncbi:hypothetical protein ACIHFE_32765 [Streptomyces sp. NPDC052396]|uniref:hypothetical protein n=1 Tax=Streptomyces sp. NPDC052396 TaxID=3365689 RepID=UPI0037D2D705
MASQTVDVVQGGGPAGDGVGRTVVTKVNVKTGDAVTFGHVLLEVSGRPVFALPGRIPVYRDLAPGAHGEDVAQLQRALTTLGLRWKPDSAGIFGDGTQRALAAFYASIGYEPVRLRQAPGDAGRATAGFRSTTLPESRAPAPQAMSTGITLPMSEVFYLNSPPARIDSLTAKVGSGVKDSLMTVSAGELSVDGSLAPSQKGLVRPGQKVQILSETTGQEATGSVTSVATAPSAPKRDDPQSGQSFAMRVTPDKQLPVGFAGQEVRLTVTAASSGGKALLVPSAAISSGADARTTVTVRSAHGRQHRVEVRTGMSGDGYVQVTPVGAGSLAAGDQVVVGLKTGTQRAG